MTALTVPDAGRLTAWRAAVDEFGDDVIHGSGFWHLTDADRRALTQDRFDALVNDLLRWSDPDRPLEERRVHCDYLWITDEDQVLGFLALRHELDGVLLEVGGHFGYSVRPSRRREGHASRALGLAVRRAAELGLERVLLTCDQDNLASARTIESNGGVYEDSREGRRRYWIDTATGSTPRQPADRR